MTCLDIDAVMALAGGSPAAVDRAALDLHLVACDRCRQLVAEAMRRTDRGAAIGAVTTVALDETADDPQGSHDPVPAARIVRQYEIIRDLGRGGMGQVVLARDTRLGRRVAIKFLVSRSPGLAHRFLAEARTTAQLHHENIVVIHEVNEHEGLPFLVLEYLEGRPLSALVREGPMPWAPAVELVMPIVKALAHAHEQGVIHRDLKPDNVFLTTTGAVKVLDFGIAKAFAAGDDGDRPAAGADLARHDLRLTHDGAMLGTLPYMSPEQFGIDEVDTRTDVWAVGLILFELLAGRHPLAPLSAQRLMRSGVALEQAMPRARDAVADLPEGLARVVDGCLRKRKQERIGSARDLAEMLRPFLPGHVEPPLAAGENPYPGLTAFQESDAGRFFGRSREIGRVVARLRQQPLLAMAGPSGVGKSSLVRAGVIPALKGSGQRWEAMTIRPGRDPIAALAGLLEPLLAGEASGPDSALAEQRALAARLREEPGTLGAVLRRRARRSGGHILLFVDQFEELYTLAADEPDRQAFAAGLAGVADDDTSPLRVVLSMRSDFLDRLAATPRLLDEVSRSLLFLAPPDRDGLRQALVQPLEMAGYRFESPATVEDMLSSLQAVPGCLPLLQFAAARLWEARDQERRLVTADAYAAMGGISGALAVHADDAMMRMPGEAQRLVRPIFQRLVTPERTRAQTDLADLLTLSVDRGDVERAIEQLVQSRLLVVQSHGEREGATVEIVHESLIATWPRLRRWLDESEEDAAFRDQLQVAAKQWDGRGRPAGLLWRGEAADEARRWLARGHQALVPREIDFLAAVGRLATRSSRIARAAVVGTIVLLTLLVAAAATGLVLLRDAEKAAVDEADRARLEEKRARAETERAQKAEGELATRLRELQQKDQMVAKGKVDLDSANHALTGALTLAQQEAARAVEERARAESERARAESERAKAETANTRLRQALSEKQAELDELKKLNRRF